MDDRVFFEDTSVSSSGLSLSTLPSNSLLNLPTVREARQTFLYYLSRHGSLDKQQSESDARSFSTLYKDILLRNVQNGDKYLVLELQGLIDADNLHHNLSSKGADFEKEHGVKENDLSRLAPLMAGGAIGRLYVALRRKPLWYIRDLEEVCHLLIKQEYSHSHYTKGLDPPHIQLLLQGQDIRPLDIRDLTVRYQEQFVVVPGILIQASIPLPKLSVAALQCRYCDHRHTVSVPATREKLVLPRLCIYATTKARESRLGVDDEQLGCSNAKNPYIVLANESVFVDTQSLKLQEHPEAVPVGDVPRSMILNASGCNCGVLRPGERVVIHGVLTNYNPQGDSYDGQNLPYVQVLRYEKESEDQNSDIMFPISEQIEFSKLAHQPDIYKRIFQSIAPALFGLEDVKKALACVLFSGVQKEHADKNLHRGDINMLMLGDPSVAKSQILKFAARASSLSVYTSGKGSSAAGLTASVVRDKHGTFALEGGAMVLADGGIVCIDEFDKMRDEDIVAMHEAMEQQTISINKAGISTMLNSRCSVIAAANPTFGSYDDSIDSSEQHEMKATILSRFDVIFMLRDKEDSVRDEKLCRHILNLQEGAVADVDESIIPLETLKRYILFARQKCSPTLSSSACEKLRTMYVQTRAAARSDKRSSAKKIPITIRQLESLYRLSEAFAKMQLCNEANEMHVEMAIDVFNASTVETAKHTLVFESLTPAQQKLVQQSEDAILSRIQIGQRLPRNQLIRDFTAKGFDKSILARAIAILIKKGTLQERADRSLRRV